MSTAFWSRSVGVWYPDRRRANLGLRVSGKAIERVGQVIGGVKLDNNTYANTAFKTALGVKRQDFVGFHICHIWGGTAYDPACYTNIANLVAIPAELSSLTDHHPHIVACLKYRAFKLYGWKPGKKIAPVKPADYPERWREPLAISDAARRAAQRRVRGKFQASGEVTVQSGEPIIKPPRLPPSGPDIVPAGIVAAFYLSKFDHGQLNLGNQVKTIDRLAKRLGINRNTLKLHRDYFDTYTGSHRQGWKVPLPPQLESAFRELDPFEEPTLRQRVLNES